MGDDFAPGVTTERWKAPPLEEQRAQKQAQLREEQHRAHQANAILANPLFKEWVERVRADAVERWLNSRDDDVAGRERMRIMVKMLDSLMADLGEHIRTGKMASAQVEQMEMRRA